VGGEGTRVCWEGEGGGGGGLGFWGYGEGGGRWGSNRRVGGGRMREVGVNKTDYRAYVVVGCKQKMWAWDWLKGEKKFTGGKACSAAGSETRLWGGMVGNS